LGALPGEGVSIRRYFPRQLFNRWRSEEMLVAYQPSEHPSPIFGQINPTLDILFDLAWQSVCSSFFRPTPIPFREWLVLPIWSAVETRYVINLTKSREKEPCPAME
jgi:hypothetical protein